MSNTYFKYTKTYTDRGLGEQHNTHDMSISLTAFCSSEPNSIQLTVNTVTSKGECDCAYITLSEKEQDDLIAGIMERRTRISATGCGQSEIHPN